MTNDKLTEPGFIDEEAEVEGVPEWEILNGFIRLGASHFIPVEAVVGIDRSTSSKRTLSVKTAGHSVSFSFNNEEDSKAFIESFIDIRSTMSKVIK